MTNPSLAAPGQRPHVELEILRGRAKNRRRRIDVPVFLIGSAHDCDLVLADDAFPEVHTYLYVTPGGVSVRRLGEGPELCVDDQPVQTAHLQDGQRLRLGTYEFALHLDSTPSRHTPEPTLAAPALGVLAGAPEAVAQVRALLDDVRAMLRVESGLKLYTQPPSPWQAITGSHSVLIRKASA